MAKSPYQPSNAARRSAAAHLDRRIAQSFAAMLQEIGPPLRIAFGQERVGYN
jgi:hypothetical protein